MCIATKAPGSRGVELNCKNQLTEVWHWNFQNTNLFALTKWVEGAGVGIVKVIADEVKPCVTAVLDQPGSCQSFPPSACGKGTAGFPVCTQRKSLAQLRN